jgi:tellurite resistance protein TerC
VTVPGWAWAAFAALVLGMLALELLLLRSRGGEMTLRQAGLQTAAWTAAGLGFGALLWFWRGGATGQAYLAGYLVERSLSLDNVFVFTVILSAFAVPPRHQHRVLMLGIIGALAMRAAFLFAGAALLNAFHAASYVFAALLLAAAVGMLRGGGRSRPPGMSWMRRAGRVLPATQRMHGQRFVVRQAGRLVATPLLAAVIAIEAADVIFAVDSVPAILAITTDIFVLYTSNVFAVLGMRPLYFLLAGATRRLRYLQPGLAVILVAVAVKLLIGDIYPVPVWASPALIAAVLAVVVVMSVRHPRRSGIPGGMEELPDRWILPLRGSRVTQIDCDDSVRFRLEPPGEIVVGRDAWFTRGPRTAPGTAVTSFRQLDQEQVKRSVGARVLSAVGFKNGALRVVFDNGWHLNVRSAGTLVPASVTSGGSVTWPRPGAEDPVS